MIPNTPLLRSTLAGLAGFFVYGGWAAFANAEHGSDIAMRSGLVQGSYSLALTFAMTYVTEYIFGRTRALVATTFLVSAILFLSAYSIHWLVGTPEILMTILPGYVVGTIYTVVYIIGLKAADGDRREGIA